MKLALLLRERRKEVAVCSVDRVNALRGERLSQNNYAYLVRFATTLLLLLSDRIEDEGFGEIWHFLDRSAQEAARHGISFGTLLKVVSFLRMETLGIPKERARVGGKNEAATEEEKELLSAQFDLCVSKIVDSFENRIRAAPQPAAAGSVQSAQTAVVRKTAGDKGQSAEYSLSESTETFRAASSGWEMLLQQSIVAGLDSGATFGSRMKELRRGQKVTLRSLAARLGFARGYISNIENGKTVPSFSAITAIARALDPDCSGGLVLLGIIERLPPQVREILTSRQKGAGKSEAVGRQQSVALTEEEEWDKDLP